MTTYKDILKRKERLDPHGKPVWPLKTEEWPSRNGDKASCDKCGLTLESVIGYCCPRAGCPSGLGGAGSLV